MLLMESDCRDTCVAYQCTASHDASTLTNLDEHGQRPRNVVDVIADLRSEVVYVALHCW